MKMLPKNVASEYEVEITHTCGKMLKKLSRFEQTAVDERINEIKANPSCGDSFKDPSLKGLLHTHARGRSSNLIIAWSTKEVPKKKILIEGVGGHDMLKWLMVHRGT